MYLSRALADHTGLGSVKMKVLGCLGEDLIL